MVGFNFLIKNAFKCVCVLSCCLLFGSKSSLITNEQCNVLDYYRAQLIEDFAFENYEVCHIQDQGYFYIDKKKDWIKKRLYEGQIWEKHVLDLIHNFAKPDTIALDIGAHIGIHTVTLSHCMGDKGLVIAFEPQKKIYNELCMNLNLNSCQNVIPIYAAVGEKEGIAYLGKEDLDSEGGRYISSKDLIEPVFMIFLDQLELKNVSFIKIDVENYEGEVLEGAYKMIMTNRPVILIEIGGGIIKQWEENINPNDHFNRILNYLESVLNYDVSLIYGRDYLAIPR